MAASPTALWVKRGLLALLGAGVVLALALALWPRAVAVDIGAVGRGRLTVTVDEEGKARIKDVYTVSAPIAGRVLRSPLEPGDVVHRDKSAVAIIAPLAPTLLDARTRQEVEAQVLAAQSAVALAEAELRQAKAELKFVESDYDRSQKLVRTNVISERALEKARLDVDTRKAAVARAEAGAEVRRKELESARAHLVGPDRASLSATPDRCCVEVHSPVSGRVLRLLQKSEQVVAMGVPLLEIGDPRSLEIVVELLSTDAVKVKGDAAALIEGWGGGAALHAKVNRIEPAAFMKVSALGIEEQRVRVVLDLVGQPDAWARLGHEFRVFARITVEEQADALLVPLGALFRQGEAWAVYAVRGNRAEVALLDVGARNGTHAAVLKGLKAGDRIILHPSDRVAAGVRVVPRANGGAQLK